MRIIKAGKIPAKPKRQCTCHNCQSVLELEHHESELTSICPVCGECVSAFGQLAKCERDQYPHPRRAPYRRPWDREQDSIFYMGQR